MLVNNGHLSGRVMLKGHRSGSPLCNSSLPFAPGAQELLSHYALCRRRLPCTRWKLGKYSNVESDHGQVVGPAPGIKSPHAKGVRYRLSAIAVSGPLVRITVALDCAAKDPGWLKLALLALCADFMLSMIDWAISDFASG